MKITREIASKVLNVVDYGLVKGMGSPQPGEMCVEAAVCYALGLPHGDNPESCVASSVRAGKIQLNDSSWSSPQARAKGMRRVAIAQLGSAGTIDETKFATYVAEQTIKRIVPLALEVAAKIAVTEFHSNTLRKAAQNCAEQGTASAARSAASAAESAASAAESAARSAARSAAWSAAWSAASAAESAAWSDEILSLQAEIFVEALQICQSPGCAFLELTEAA